MLPEHFHRVDYKKQTLAARQHHAAECADFTSMEMLAAFRPNRPAHCVQLYAERDRLKVVHRHVTRQSHDSFLAVHLAHGFIQDGGDDASVYVAGRPFETARHAEVARHTAVCIFAEAQAQSVPVGRGTAEAIVGEGRHGVR